MLKNLIKICAASAALFLITAAITEQIAFARAGGGRSFGGRGSRSFSRPASPSSPSSPGSQPAPAYSQPNTAQPGGGLLRSLGMGLAGGFLGSMLFRGLGYGSTGWGEGSGGVGPLEILIIGGLGFMLYRMYKRRKEGSGGSSLFSGGLFGGNPENSSGRQSDLSGIKMSDSSFDESRFKDNVMDIFFKIQAAWMNRDLSPVKSLLTDEMKNIFQEDIDAMLDAKKINRLENIAVRSVDISEAWQESGQDYITALIYANILDYTVDENSGDVVKGSKTEPTKFEEYWTFSRQSGSKQWMLSAINQA
jgi:predicted lipid-binding transport protein (Tim44 family)